MMKKICVCAVLAAVCVTATACGGQQSQTETTTQAATAAVTTQAPTTEPPTTEPPTENQKEAAYQAYLDYMQGHSEWFFVDEPTFSYTMKQNPIAFCDINGDGVEELIHYRPQLEEKTGKINLCIVTYRDGVQTLYDDEVVNLPGAEAGYSVFVGNDNKLYSVTAKELNGHVIRFDMDGTELSAQTLADSQAHHLAEPEEAVCHVEGADVSYQAFQDYRKSVENKVKTYLLINYQNSRGAEVVSMSYTDAYDYLKNQIEKRG